MTVFAYYRVSTDRQDYESQKIGVVEYAKRAGLTIDKEIIDDGVSGTVVAKKRNLGKLLKEMKAGDTIITGELSRLGRSTVDVITTCNLIAQRGVNCYLVKQGMSIDSTPMGKLMTAIFSAFAEMERDLISQRTKEGLARTRAMGTVLGHPRGKKNAKTKLSGREDDILLMVKNNHSQKSIAKRFKVSPITIHRFLKSRS